MTTDDERREVARMLRELPGDSTYPDLIGIIADRDGWYPAADAADRLADLIEPSEPQVKRELKYRSRCDELGAEMKRQRDALLKLADDIDKQTDGSMFDIWLEDGHYIARRIREALSVSAAT